MNNNSRIISFLSHASNKCNNKHKAKINPNQLFRKPLKYTPTLIKYDNGKANTKTNQNFKSMKKSYSYYFNNKVPNYSNGKFSNFQNKFLLNQNNTSSELNTSASYNNINNINNNSVHNINNSISNIYNNTNNDISYNNIINISSTNNNYITKRNKKDILDYYTSESNNKSKSHSKNKLINISRRVLKNLRSNFITASPSKDNISTDNNKLYRESSLNNLKSDINPNKKSLKYISFTSNDNGKILFQNTISKQKTLNNSNSNIFSQSFKLNDASRNFAIERMRIIEKTKKNNKNI